MKRITAGAVAAVIIVLLEIAFFATTDGLTGLPWLQPTGDDAMIAARHQMARESTAEIVLIGDSSCLTGYRPELLEQRLGHSVLNLGSLSSFSVEGFAMLGRQAIEANRPKALVLITLPQAFGVSEAQAREYDQIGRYLVAYGLESPVYAPTLVEHLSWGWKKHEMNRIPAQMGGSFEAFQGQLKAEGGWLAEERDYAGAREGQLRDTFVESPWAIASLRELARFASERGVQLYLWGSPSPRDAVTDGYVEDVWQYVRSESADLDSLRVPQEELPVWAPERFGTITHVRPESAEELSQLLAAALEAELTR